MQVRRRCAIIFESMQILDTTPVYMDHFAERLFDRVEQLSFDTDTAKATYSFGDFIFDLTFVGKAFADRLTRAIKFAVVEADPPLPTQWRVIAVDGQAGGVAIPPNWKGVSGGHRRHAERLHQSENGQLIVRFNPDTITWSGVSYERRLAVVWTSDASTLPDWEEAAPFRDLFHWMTLPSHCFLAHTAAIGLNGRAVLLTGAGGSGKSTTTAAAILAGLQTTGDDFVLIDPDDSRALAIYDTIKLDAKGLAWLPRLAELSIDQSLPPSAKRRIHLFPRYGDLFVKSLSISAILLPRVAHLSTTQIKPATSAEAFRALIPSTTCLIRLGETATIRKASAFLRTLPTYHCDLGHDPVEAARTIGHFLS
jgi:hypothetical protein